MPNSETFERAVASLRLFPRELRGRIIDDDTFREQLDIDASLVITFAEDAAKIDAHRLLKAIQTHYATPKRLVSVRDEDGRQWQVTSSTRSGEDHLFLSLDGTRLVLPGSPGLLPTTERRVRALKQRVKRALLSAAFEARWKPLMSKRRLTHVEARRHDDDYRTTPAMVTVRIAAGVERGESKFTDLVPAAESYYLELLGGVRTSQTLIDFAASEAPAYLDWLLKLDPTRGLERFLVLASHSSIVRCVSERHLRRVDLKALVASIETNGSLLAKLGIVELLLALGRDEFDVELSRILKGMVADDGEQPSSRFKLLASLFMFVEGELSRTGTLAAWPPWARRLVSLAHASIIEMQVIGKADIGQFADTLIENRGHAFLCQSLVDLRQEPRWRPDFATADQLRQEFLGRILNAGVSLRESPSRGLARTLFGEEQDSALSQVNWVAAFMPGPLEGSDAGGTANPLPEALQTILDDSLAALDSPARQSLTPILNLSAAFTLPQGALESAVQALRDAGHRISGMDEDEDRFALMVALAYAAAGQRSRALADEIRIICRFARNRGRPFFGHAQELLVAVIASAAEAEIESWCRLLGEWAVELTFAVEDAADAGTMRDYLVELVRAAPDLWIGVGPADAALEALLTSCAA